MVIFTASLPAYANPVIDWLDRGPANEAFIKARLYRDACVFAQGLYIKDLSRIGVPLSKCLLIDNSPASFLLQPDHAIGIKSWFEDDTDEALLSLAGVLDKIADVGDVCEWRQGTFEHEQGYCHA